ncbi:MAG: hypothetical protein WB626_06370 [Bacteroidota bacterium]
MPPLVSAILAGMLFAASACTDMGDKPPSALPLTATPAVVTLGAGGTAAVAVTGGVPPYRITEHPDSTVAAADLQHAGSAPGLLSITARTQIAEEETTRVRVGDAAEGTPSEASVSGSEITILIRVNPAPALTALPPSVTVTTGQTVPVTIGNGTPPYEIAESPDAGLASAQFLDPSVTPAILRITGVSIASAAGSTRVKVKDSTPSPEREVTIPITKNP